MAAVLTGPGTGPAGAAALPADDHVHSEWSWDAADGSMERSCARAVELGLPSIAFTEHLDHTVWTVDAAGVDGLPADHPVVVHSDADGRVRPPAFDPAGYLEAVDRCRHRFPGLRIRTGLELGEPHRHPEAVARVLAAGPFDRILGSLHSLHSLPHEGAFHEPAELFRRRDPAEALRAYLLEVVEVAAADPVEILAHIDYPLRSWPFDPALFEDEFRHALRATAGAGTALEINTAVPLPARIVRWWYEEGGAAVSFGSDAHAPDRVARGFPAAAALAEAHGFHPAADPLALWTRRR